MAIPESPIPPQQMPQQMMKMVTATQWQTIATLTAAIVQASGKPHSIAQVLEIANDFHHAIFPNPSTGAYKEWEKTREQRLNKVHGPV